MAEVLKVQYRFHLNVSKSPTYYNLNHALKKQGWKTTPFKWSANVSEKNFEFDPSAAKILEYKNLLAQLTKEYCPAVVPATYCINDYNWSSVLTTISNKYYNQKNTWILKPALLNNGKHIKIFQQLSQIEQHFLSSNRLGGDHVLQQYITNPHLLRGHKYSIRLFVVMTNYASSFIYPHGYFNVSLQPYQPDTFSDLGPHLTNEHLTDQQPNVIQIPTAEFDIFPPIYQQIKKIVADTIHGLQQLKPQAFVCEKKRTLAIFGFDFMMDSDQRVWLLEANHGPCFPTTDDHPLQNYLYADFWQALIASFILPIASRQAVEKIRYISFEPVV